MARESWDEPAWDCADYPEWALRTAVDRRIDVFAPQRGRRGIAAIADRFEKAGVRLESTAGAAELELIDDKVAFAQDLASHPLMPFMIRVTSTEEFMDAVGVIEQRYGQACVKPSRGIFGRGYWTLSRTPLEDSFTAYDDPDARVAHPDAYAQAMTRASAEGRQFDLAVMEYLPGMEASVDVIARRGVTVLAGVRSKLTGSRQLVTNRHELVDAAAGLVERYRLNGAVNVQFKRNRGGEWRILEINARVAGGASYNDVIGIPYSATWMDVLSGAPIGEFPAVEGAVDGIVTAWLA